MSESSRLYQDLVEEYGPANLFMDVDSLPLGEQFPEYIRKRIIACSVVLVVIGRSWLNSSKDGLRRIDDTQDFVRREVCYALENDKLIIPVLIENAALPDQHELPDDIKLLSQRQALKLHYSYWDVDLRRLKQSLRLQRKGYHSKWSIAAFMLLL